MSDLSLAALEQQAAMGGSIGADILGTTAGAGLSPLISIGGPASLFASILYGMLKDDGLQETPMTPEERIAFENAQRLALASEQLAQGGEGAKETVLDAIGQAVADGVNQAEIDYVTELLRRGDITVEDVSLSTGIPESEIQAVYDQQRREPSPLELLQTGAVQTVDVEGGTGDVAGTGDITAAEEVIDLSKRTTDDLTTIDDLITDTTASTITDAGALDVTPVVTPENPWVYQGDGNFRHSQTGETIYNADAATNPAYVVGESYSGPESGTRDTVDITGDFVDILTGAKTGTGKVFNTVSDLIGPQGERGAIGPQGEMGPQGEQGIQGIQGETGATGAQGIQGERGETGATGPQGERGETGATGATGAQGERGETGAQGPQGEPGKSGLIMMLAQQAPITEQMFSRELFEPQMKELDNVAKALGMLQSIARPFV